MDPDVENTRSVSRQRVCDAAGHKSPFRDLALRYFAPHYKISQCHVTFST